MQKFWEEDVTKKHLEVVKNWLNKTAKKVNIS